MRIKDLSELYTSGLKQVDAHDADEGDDGAKSAELIPDVGHTLGFDRLERSLAEDLGLFALILISPASSHELF